MPALARRDFLRLCTLASATVGGATWACGSEARPVGPLVEVASSSIAAIGYDERRRTLEIAFRTGARYRYQEVPKAIHAEFMRADSKGRYFAKRIRGKFKFVRMPEAP